MAINECPPAMSGKRLVAIATLLFVTFFLISLAAAAETSLKLTIQNVSYNTKTVDIEKDLTGSYKLVPGTQKVIKAKQTAYWQKTITHYHDVLVYEGGVRYCLVQFWINNRVNFFGNVGVLNSNGKSYDPDKCTFEKKFVDDDKVEVTIRIINPD